MGMSTHVRRALHAPAPAPKATVERPAARRDGSVDAVLSRPGVPLDWSVRGPAEREFGHDFSNVRVHNDSSADAAARSLHAKAFTYGSHIAFSAGRFRPSNVEGRGLLAHELAHVVQQTRGGRADEAGLEADAQRASAASVLGAGPADVRGASEPHIARDGEEETPLWKRTWAGAKRSASGLAERAKAIPQEVKQTVVEKYEQAKDTAQVAAQAVETRVEAVKAEASAKLARLTSKEGRATALDAVDRALHPTLPLAEKSSQARRNTEAWLATAKQKNKDVGRATALNTLMTDVDGFVQAWNHLEVDSQRTFAETLRTQGLGAAIKASQKKTDENLKTLTDAFKKTVGDYEDGTVIPPLSDKTLIDPTKHPTLAAVEKKTEGAVGAVAGLGRQVHGGVAIALWSMGTGLANISVHPVNTIKALGELPGPGGIATPFLNPLKATGQTVGLIDDLITSEKSTQQVLKEYGQKQLPSKGRDAEQTKTLLKGLGENYIEAAGYKLDPNTEGHPIVPGGKAKWGRIPGLLAVDVGSFFIPGGAGTKGVKVAAEGGKALEGMRGLEALGQAEKGLQVTGELGKGAEIADATKALEAGSGTPKVAPIAQEGKGAEQAAKAAGEAKAAQAAQPRRVPLLDDAIDRVKKLVGEPKPANEVVPPVTEPTKPYAAPKGGEVIDLPADRPRQPTTHQFKKDSPPVQSITDAKPAAPKDAAAAVDAMEADAALADLEHQGLVDAAPQKVAAGAESRGPVAMARPPKKAPPATKPPATTAPSRPASPPAGPAGPARSPRDRRPFQPRQITARPKEGPTLPPGYEDIYESGYAQREAGSPGRPETEQAVAGKFTHQNWRELPGWMGLDPHDIFTHGVEELFTGRTPNAPVIREFPIPHPDYPPGFQPRPDVLNPGTARAVEIGPSTAPRLKFVEAQQYAEWMNRYFPRTDGVRWTPAHALYHQQLVIDWLKDIGYLPR